MTEQTLAERLRADLEEMAYDKALHFVEGMDSPYADPISDEECKRLWGKNYMMVLDTLRDEGFIVEMRDAYWRIKLPEKEN